MPGGFSSVRQPGRSLCGQKGRRGAPVIFNDTARELLTTSGIGTLSALDCLLLGSRLQAGRVEAYEASATHIVTLTAKTLSNGIPIQSSRFRSWGCAIEMGPSQRQCLVPGAISDHYEFQNLA